MTDQRFYGDRAELYDRIYHFKNYAAESDIVRRALAAHGVARGARVLEAACGTGLYLEQLQRWYEVSGFDLHEGSIAVARDNRPDLDVFVADMREFSVPDPFDAIVCLFSSIGYVAPGDELNRALTCFRQALKPNGVLLVEPWLPPEQLKTGHASQHNYEGDDMKIERSCVSKREGRRSIFDFHFLVARTDGDVEHFVDRHVLWLITRDEMLAALSAAGFSEARFDPELELAPKRGLFTARA